MLRCEIDRNLPNQTVDIYLYDRNRQTYYEILDGNIIQKTQKETHYTMKPFISLPYEFADIMFDSITEFNTKMKLEEGTVVSAKNAHINDLNKVLNHFMAKENK